LATDSGMWPPGLDRMEGCLPGDLVAMTVKMSRARIGDYWEDADRTIRNHFAEAQYIRWDLLERIAICPGSVPIRCSKS